MTGDVLLQNADCAEEFDVTDAATAEPGSVMVISQDGRLELCSAVGDRRVAGVVSGAGQYSPALILDQQESSVDRVPVALMGKVFCKVDAAAGAILPGDLLTTSETAGHVQKLTSNQAVGTVVGRALQPHAEGQGMIAILVTLQ